MLMLLRFKKRAYRSLAGFMALWLSGLLFFVCCEKLNAKTAEIDSCPLAKMSKDCHRTAEQNREAAAVLPSEEDCFECCGFLPAVFDKARKIEPAQKQLFTPAKKVVYKLLPALVTYHETVVSRVPAKRIADKQRSFIANCVFRI